MTGPTHRQYGVAFGFIGIILLYKYGGGSLINYYLSLLILMPAAKFGAEFPDLDHFWGNVRNKTIPNRIINILIHVTGGKHRSWQTHSLDIMVLSCVGGWYLPDLLLNRGLISVINKEIIKIIITGFNCGWASHLLADMMTSGGVRLFFWSKAIVKLVPRKLFGLSFKTGASWEKFVYKTVKKLNILLGLVCLLFPLIDKYVKIELLIR